MFIEILIFSKSIANDSNFTKCIFLCNQQCMTTRNFIDFNTDEHNQELHCYPFAVSLGRWSWSFNASAGLSDGICVPNCVFNTIARKKECKMYM